MLFKGLVGNSESLYSLYTKFAVGALLEGRTFPLAGIEVREKWIVAPHLL
jgi:hypothetical protein